MIPVADSITAREAICGTCAAPQPGCYDAVVSPAGRCPLDRWRCSDRQSAAGPGKPPLIPEPSPEPLAPLPDPIVAEIGRRLWALLHAYADSYAPHGNPAGIEEQAAALDWLAAWTECVPDYGCACGQEWEGILREMPPRVETRAHLQAWCSAAHDAVNAKLGKPLFRPGHSALPAVARRMRATHSSPRMTT